MKKMPIAASISASTIILTAGLNAVATATTPSKAPDFSVKLNERAGNIAVTALPPPNHHFNIQAPMKLIEQNNGKSMKPVSAKERKIDFALPGLHPRKFTLNLYLCDDAKTYCEKKQVNSSWDN